MQLSSKTIALLEDIERRLDPETETDFENQWRDFLFDCFDGELFAPEKAFCPEYRAGIYQYQRRD